MYAVLYLLMSHLEVIWIKLINNKVLLTFESLVALTLAHKAAGL